MSKPSKRKKNKNVQNTRFYWSPKSKSPKRWAVTGWRRRLRAARRHFEWNVLLPRNGHARFVGHIVHNGPIRATFQAEKGAKSRDRKRTSDTAASQPIIDNQQ